jgi:negative regulator of flagellin synthesis FlgM
MKINSQPDFVASLPVSTGTQTNRANLAGTASAKATKDAVSSGVAVTVSSLAKTLELANRGESADVDLEKVSTIRTAIEQGNYAVNPEAIADKLLSNAQEMLQRARN